jgi:hypothetical protein
MLSRNGMPGTSMVMLFFIKRRTEIFTNQVFTLSPDL